MARAVPVPLATLVLLIALVAAPLAAEAQPAGKVYRIGILSTLAVADISGANPTHPHIRALVQRLGELGWAFGKNLVTEPRGADGKLERFPALAEELVRAGVDVIVTTGGNPAALAAKQSTSTIPVVMAVSGDPVGAGIVPQLARPVGNITGMSMNAGPEIQAKRLDLLKETVAGISRVGVISRAGGRAQPWHRVLRTAAETLNVALVDVHVASPGDYPAAFATLSRERVDALFASDTPLNFHNQRLIIDFAARQRLPAVYSSREFVEAGGLMGYGVDVLDVYRRAAGYVDRILKGAKPADLPIEQPTKFEFVINLRTAKALGLTIPQSVLVRADELIQ